MNVFIMLVVLALFLLSLWPLVAVKQNRVFKVLPFLIINGILIPALMVKNSLGEYIIYELVFASLFIIPEFFLKNNRVAKA